MEGLEHRHTCAEVLVEELAHNIADGQVLPNVHRCLLRIESPQLPTPSAAAAAAGDDPALRTGSAFRIASVTKMFTATALLALVDRGECALDDSIERHLGADIVDQFRDHLGHPYGAEVTLRQLLDHTSGLPNYFLEPPILEAVMHGDGRRRFAPSDLLHLAAGSTPPTSPPGTTRAYTDTGFVLAGLIIESLTELPLDEAYRELVLDHIGMPNTWLESSTATPRQSEIAAHDLQDRQDISDLDPTVDWAGGGLVSTATDLAAFLRALTGGELLADRSWREMTRWTPGPAGYYDDYGLGLGRYQFESTQVIGHHGAWGAFAFWSPELDAVITGTVNTARVDRRPLLSTVVNAMTLRSPSDTQGS